MNNDLHSDKGFLLSEVLLAVGLIAVACALVIPAFTKSVEWAKKRSALAELVQLNDALDYHRLEWGNESIPKGNHDVTHHEAVLKALVLKNVEHVQPRELKSKGEGGLFCFTEYKGQKLKSKEDVPKISVSYAGWMGSAGGDNNWASSGSTLGEIFLENGIWEKEETNFRENRNKMTAQEMEDFLKRKEPQQPSVGKKEYFERPGSYDWIVPQGLSNITVELVGGGGSGARPKRKITGWGNMETIPTNGVQVGRFDCKHGNYRGVGSYNLTGPLKFHVYSDSGAPFIESFKVSVNGKDKCYFSLGQNSIVECSEEGTLKIDFLIRTHQHEAGPWIKEKRWGKKYYHDNFTFNMSLKVEYPIFNFYRGNGGGSGGYSQKQFSGLRGGETVFITVGKGGQSGPGETTSVKVNGLQFSATGGGVATDQNPGVGGRGMVGDVNQQGASGLTSEDGGKGGSGFNGGRNANIMMGAGGAGAIHRASIAGEDGNCGMVVIIYKG